MQSHCPSTNAAIPKPLQLLLRGRVALLALGHLAVFALVFGLAFALRFDFAIPPFALQTLWACLPWVLALKLAIFYYWGQYHGWWSYVTFSDLSALVRAATLSLLVLAAVDHFVIPQQIPRSVLMLDWLLTIVAFGGLRASSRMIREQFRPWWRRDQRRPALLVGADLRHGMLAHQINSHLDLGYRIDGLLATNGESRHSRLGQLVVRGPVEELPKLAMERCIQDILAVAGALPGARLRELMTACKAADLDLKIIPPLKSLFNSNGQLPLRSIEISDLLRRDPVQLDWEAIGELLAGRRVMVTGAGGSIGSEICRQVFKFQPAELILLGRGENRIFALDRELREQPPDPADLPRGSDDGRGDAGSTDSAACPSPPPDGPPATACPAIIPVIGDVTDETRMRHVFERYRPEIIFHAAAHKHVPLMEHNVSEAVKNNVLGTQIVADLADEYDSKAFVLISSDKAVHPTSVMGTTKHLAERYVHSLGDGSATRFVSVRFGNVLGSAGSVVPIFQDQIRRGGPLTITDPRMTRYFMTIPEATQLVLQAAAMGHGGEIFVLDMGQPVRIVDLARDLIRLSGLPEDAVEISYVGIRPGEKLYEELYFSDERTLPTAHPKLRAAGHRPTSLAETRRQLAELKPLTKASDAEIRRKLHQLVPEFNPKTQQPQQPAATPATP